MKNDAGLLIPKMYTDSGILYFEITNNEETNYRLLHEMMYFLGVFQTEVMVESNFLIRGGISMGELYDEDFIFGNGYNAAYKIENEKSKWSRILVDKKYLN